MDSSIQQHTAPDLQVFELSNGEIAVKLTNYGATVMTVHTPDRRGRKANIVAGFEDPTGYLTNHPYFGCTIGRFSNRIAGGRFELDGQVYQLTLNEKINQLHGGWEGFNRKMWNSSQADKRSVSFTYFSPDGEEGFPGNLKATVKYSLTDLNEMIMEYTAVADRPTIVSLTNHSYFNLSGFENDTILDHVLQIHADGYTVKNAANTSTGEIGAILNSPLDFRSAKPIGLRIDQMGADLGYDHNYTLPGKEPAAEFEIKKAPQADAILRHEVSGRVLKVYTDQPGLQLYTANWWDGTIIGAQGSAYIKHGAVALETQAWPGAPNHENFPPAVLRPGEVYRSYTIFEFLTE